MHICFECTAVHYYFLSVNICTLEKKTLQSATNEEMRKLHFFVNIQMHSNRYNFYSIIILLFVMYRVS